MDESTLLFVRFRGKITGPFTLGKLQLMRDVGRLTAIHEVSVDGLVWQSAAEAGIVKGNANSFSTPFQSPRFQASAGETQGDLQSSTGTADGQRWFYLDDARNRVGPCSPEEMLEKIQQGAITRYTQVWTEALGQWKTADQTELAPHLQASPAAKSNRRGAGFVPLGYLTLVMGLILAVWLYFVFIAIEIEPPTTLTMWSFFVPPLFSVVTLICGIVNLVNKRMINGIVQFSLGILATAGLILFGLLFNKMI